MKKKIVDGNEACSYVSYNFTEVAGIYPITPASPMAEITDEWSSKGKLNYFNRTVKVVQMQSEAGAIGMVHGSLQSGCLTTTYTASQGLLLMLPNMYKIAGEQLPFVMNVAARSIATHALSIYGDHQDIYAARMTGFAMLASSNQQQVHDLTAVAHLSTIKGKVPFINFFDGFRTSHELQKIDVIDTEKVKELIDYDKLTEFRKRALIPGNNITKGTSQNEDIYFQMTEVRNKYYDELPDIVNDYMEQINKITNKEYKPFNYYGDKEATRIIIAMGSVCQTIEETVDYLNNKDEKVGLIEVHLYRPFSSKYLLDVLPETVKEIAVLDRTKEPGSNEPLYLDIVNVIKENNLDINVIGGRYGLSSKNTDPKQILAVYDFLNKEDKFNSFTIGIEDDITNKSLKPIDIEIPNNNIEYLIYGYGSDGMVSASKDLIKITGTYTNAYVQQYSQYDSKKSGGVTINHLRFSKEPIKSTYFVEKANIILCTKDSYLNKYNILEKIKDNGIFILNTNKSKEELYKILTKEDIEILNNKNITMYIIDANEIADNVGIKGKISTIMETILFKVGKVIDYDFAINKLKEDIEKRFINKGNDLVEKNIEAISLVEDLLVQVDVKELNSSTLKDNNLNTIFDYMDKRMGDQLKVSAFIDNSDGSFTGGTTSLEKRCISSEAPSFNKDNCIMCNMCSFVCPHAVIRPYLLTKEELDNAPDSIKEKVQPANIKDKELYYMISTSIPDCTGCTLCVNICPGKKGVKALEMMSTSDLEVERKENEYLEKYVSEKNIMNKDTVKGSQFIKPTFEYSGACSGCGETPYLKLLTQLFKEKLVMANATGCSSIYGASIPSLSYSTPWANSLFEDNAEYGYGMKIADIAIKDRIKSIIESNIDNIEINKEIYTNYLEDINEQTANDLYNIVDNSKIEELIELKEYIKPKSVWIVGGDGWAYDIGFSGIDHVLANRENVNILVLDTEVYSNTGGQASKSSNMGSVAKFATTGKLTAKKDLTKIALTYPHVYVASISLGANMQQTIKALTEAEKYDGPSIIIAYAPCIAQGILTGMSSTIEEEKKAVQSGYYPLFRYNPTTDEFLLDAKPDFDKYYEFISGEDRYRILKKINPDKYKELLEEQKRLAMERFSYYEKLSIDKAKIL
ncbi:MAG: pyruvate:ferredoxin (flavodoxin) oxidoreductase [Bacilli bacterium]|nr:pyruvate:ferredoxin (flavodoxin) oxidoreductase [Bacilli bacterium]